MARFADYVVVRDQPFVLQTGGDTSEQLAFSLTGGDMALGLGSVLFYFLVIESSNTQLAYRIRLNGHNVGTFSVAAGPSFQSIHEVIGPNVLEQGANQIQFSIVEGSGQIRISDVFILCKENT